MKTKCRGRGRPFVKGQKAWNYARVEIICEFCKKSFMVSPSRKETAKHCSTKCHNTIISRKWDHSGDKNPMWKGGIQTYRQFKKASCERCGSIKYLDVHHKDENRYNNVIENLETLCKSCHHKHHKRSKNFKGFKRPITFIKRICERCLIEFSRRKGSHVNQRWCSRKCAQNSRSFHNHTQ